MVRAYVLIEMVAGHSRDLVNTLSRVVGVTEVARVTGPYDVIVTLEAQDLEEISEDAIETLGETTDLSDEENSAQA